MKIASELDVPYDPKHQLNTDLYYDSDSKSYRGAIIDIHGGGWFRGDKTKDADWATRLAAENYFVFVPNYRYAPKAHYPAPLEDMSTLYNFVQQSDYPFDHDHVAAVGSSAGGNMTVEMAIKFGIPAVSLSGILDIDDWLQRHVDVVPNQGDTAAFNQMASSEINQTGANDAFYKWFVVNYFDNDQTKYTPATPYHRVSEKTGPMFLANSLDEFVPNSGVLTMAHALVDKGIAFTTRFLTGSRHAKGYLDNVFDETLLFLNTSI